MVDNNNNNNGYGPNFQFKGQVKIEDVKNQLDLLIDDINNMIDTYNDAGYVTDIDLNDVSPELSPMDYTLSVGGLRKVLDAYDGAVSGCTVFTDKDKENLYISSGILFTRNGGYGLPSAVIKNEGQKEIWYSPSLNKYKGSAATVKTTTEFKMPTITSNESWGKITAADRIYYRGKTYRWNMLEDQNSKAFNATNSTGYQYVGAGANLDTVHLYLTWENWPKTVNLSKVEWTLDYLQGSQSFINPWTALEIKEGSTWKTVVQGHEVGRGTQTCTLDNVAATGIRITLDWDKSRYPSGSLKNITISGTAESSSPAGGGASDASDWIKVAILDQNTDKNYLNINDFRLAPKNLRVAANTNNTPIETSDTVDNSKADRYLALPFLSGGNLSLYSKIYLPKSCGYSSWGSDPKVAKVRNISL